MQGVKGVVHDGCQLSQHPPLIYLLNGVQTTVLDRASPSNQLVGSLPVPLFFCNSAVPSQPSEFKGEAKSETSILLSWVAPPQGGPDNQITGYELVYRRADDTEEVGLKGGASSFSWDL